MEILFRGLLELIGMTIVRFLRAIRGFYYRLRYPNKYLRAKKLADLDDGIHFGTKLAGWILVITTMLLLLLLFYKLTGFFD